MNMYQLLEKAAATWPDNFFLVREKVTFSQFIEQVKARAASLRRSRLYLVVKRELR